MKDKEVDTYLRQHFSEDSPREAFRQQALRDSAAALIRVRRRRSALRRAEMTAAAVLIAGIAFLGGRLSAPHTLPGSIVITPPLAAAEPDGLTVPSELVAWLDAARLFRQLGMEDRMARAVERAGRLLPVDTVIGAGQAGQIFAAGSIENQKRMELTGIPGSNLSADSIKQILANSFGD